MSEFDELQAVIRRRAGERQGDQRACEAFLNALYHALRRASGPGLPLNNVSMDVVADPLCRVKPVPIGAMHAAWVRLGLCEVLIRVRLDDGAFAGEFGHGGVFRQEDADDDALLVLARRMLREIADMYAGEPRGLGSALN